MPVAGQETEATIIRQIFDTFAKTANAIAVSMEILMTEAAVRSAAGEEIDMQALHEGLSASMQSVVNESRDYVTETSVGEQQVSAMQYYAAAMAAMFLLFNAMAGGKSLHRERQTVTLVEVDDDAGFTSVPFLLGSSSERFSSHFFSLRFS